MCFKFTFFNAGVNGVKISGDFFNTVGVAHQENEGRKLALPYAQMVNTAVGVKNEFTFRYWLAHLECVFLCHKNPIIHGKPKEKEYPACPYRFFPCGRE